MSEGRCATECVKGEGQGRGGGGCGGGGGGGRSDYRKLQWCLERRMKDKLSLNCSGGGGGGGGLQKWKGYFCV